MRRLVGFGLVGVCSLAWAVAELPEVGDAVGDRVLLSDARALSHVEAALTRSGVTVGDLFTDSALELQQAPDPSALLSQMYAENQRRVVAAGGANLKVLCYNVGLLSRKKILGLFGLVEVPEIALRRKAQPEILLSADYDVLLLQEVWENEDAAAFAAAAAAHGYRSWAGSEALRDEHGLQILVRESLVAGGWQTHEMQYEAQYGLEYWPGPGLKRGALWVSFDHPQLGRVHLADTHTTAFPSFWRERLAQARELGLLLSQEGAPDDLVILGGDFNASAYYPVDSWTSPDGEVTSDWWANALSYGASLHYLDAVDLFAMGTKVRDVELGKGIVNRPEQSTLTPMGEPGWCQRAGRDTYTASDCNSLYFRNYAGTEMPARMDLVLARDPMARIKVTDASLRFVEPMDLGGDQPFELSDHYAVSLNLAVAPRAGAVPTPQPSPQTPANAPTTAPADPVEPQGGDK